MSFISALAAQVAPQVKTAASAVETAAKSIVMSAGETAKRAKIADTAKNFESSFLSVMMQQMSEGVKGEAPFSGGEGEQAFKSLLSEAMAKNITKAGGIGLASTIQREMLKMQGLKE